MQIIEPPAEFRALTEEEVLAGLADHNATNVIAMEVVRLIAGYGSNFADHCAKVGSIPASVLAKTPTSPIEKIARELFETVLDEELAAL